MKTIVEIHAAEGGEDSKLFVRTLAQAYGKLFLRKGWTSRTVLDVPGECHIEVSGKDLTQLANEPGCHKLQRIPPTERKGRVHTSAVTVAVLDKQQRQPITIEPSDLRIEWYSGTGCGGQNRNKVQTSCRLTHIPTGIVQTAQTRSRENSYQEALAGLHHRLTAQINTQIAADISTTRQNQMGNGSNSNLVRMYCFQHGLVKGTNGKQITTKQFEKGLIDSLW